MTLRLSGGRRLRSPPGAVARPTPSRVRLAVMDLLARELQGCRWLDLCCGSGVMSCEALQRGAREVVAVERDRRVAAVARANLQMVSEGLGSGEVSLICADVQRWLSRSTPAMQDAINSRGLGFDVIYADPPYRAGLYGPLARLISRGGWLRTGGTMLWECASDHVPDVPPGWQRLGLRRYGGSSVLLLSQEVQDPRPLHISG